MSTCNFSIDLSGTAEELIAKAQSGIIAMGGSFEGNTETGSYSISTPLGKVSGTYIVQNNAANFTIHEKPMFLSCNMIEEQLRKQI
ncbi:MAG: hypothetical protein V4658_08405 [Bacteroidota bacterium]